jgi:hypothetical protein
LPAPIQPAIASTGDQVLTVWTSFVGGQSSFDMMAQRFAITPSPLQPTPPFVSPLSQNRLSVTWPELQGYAGVRYEIYMDDAVEPVVVEGNSWTATGLMAATAHSFRLGYRLPDGSRSSISEPGQGRTWGR